MTEYATLAGGCFWCTEAVFKDVIGVESVESIYIGGTVPNPTYKQVCYDDTGHAETVKVVFDPARISYERLLEAFFVMHDPTQLNRQGPDVGDQYRSGIYYTSEAQKKAAEAYIAKLTASGKYRSPIVTEVEAAQTFYPAEEYHQDYIVNTGRACHVKNPW